MLTLLFTLVGVIAFGCAQLALRPGPLETEKTTLLNADLSQNLA
jgi:hypothetical protein